MKLTILIFMLIAIVLCQNYCGGNCPSGRCADCPCGTTKKMLNITQWCAKYTWDQTCCKCIVTHQSQGNANAMNYDKTTFEYDIGLWQISTLNWCSCSGGKPPCDPNINLQCAIQVYKWGSNSFKFWATQKGCGC